MVKIAVNVWGVLVTGSPYFLLKGDGLIECIRSSRIFHNRLIGYDYPVTYKEVIKWMQQY